MAAGASVKPKLHGRLAATPLTALVRVSDPSLELVAVQVTTSPAPTVMFAASFSPLSQAIESRRQPACGVSATEYPVPALSVFVRVLPETVPSSAVVVIESSMVPVNANVPVPPSLAFWITSLPRWLLVKVQVMRPAAVGVTVADCAARSTEPTSAPAASLQ